MNGNGLPREYYNYITKHPILKAYEEAQLFKKMDSLYRSLRRATEEMQRDEVEAGITTCKHRIISSNMRLVVSIAKGFVNRSLGMQDLIDEGTVGLIEAVDRFDYKRGFRFATYATWWVRQAIMKSLGNSGSSLRLPVHAIYTLKKHSVTYSDLAQQYGRPPDLHEISSQLQIPEKKLRDLMAVAQRASSLDEAIDETGRSNQDSLVDEKSTREIQGIVDRELICKTLRSAFDRLNAKEVEVLRLRYGLNDSPQLTLEETCRELGITRERVRQIQKKALEKMRGTKELQHWRA